MSTYEHDMAQWNFHADHDFNVPERPNRNDYDSHGYKKGTVTYKDGLILDNYLITTYGMEYAMREPLGKY